jgi:hypothetical protein
MGVIQFPGSEPPTGPTDPEAVAILASDATRAVMQLARGETQWQLEVADRIRRIENGHTDWQCQLVSRQRAMHEVMRSLANEQTRQARSQIVWPKFAYAALAVFGGAMAAYALRIFETLLTR